MSDDMLAAVAARGWRVPAFRVDVLREKRTRYVTIIPVINEGERIRAQLRDMKAQGLTGLADTVVVDGGSTDGSLALDFLREVGLRALVTKTGPGKLSAQLRCAYAWAMLEGYDGVITIDGNGKDGVEAVPLFVEALDQGYGYAQASRFVRGGVSENTPAFRLFGIRLVHAPILSLAAGRWLTDTTQGFRAYSSAYLLDPGTQPFRDEFVRYELLAYLTARASQLGYRVKEIPTRRSYPRDEPTPTKIHGLRPIVDLVVVALRTLLRRYHPSRRSSGG